MVGSGSEQGWNYPSILLRVWYCVLEVQISWQAQHFVNLHAQGSWHAQQLVNRAVQIAWQAPYQMLFRERADARNAAIFNRRAALKLARQAVQNDERETVSRMPGSWSDQAQSRVGTIPLL